jgi:molybdopterin molybdotransferase
VLPVAQLTDDCFAHGGALLPLDQALADLKQRLGIVADTETMPLDDCLGRAVAEAITARVSVPPQANSAVDGYAVYFDDLNPNAETVLPIAGRAAAGHPFAQVPPRGSAVRIFTGALMPDGTDTVLMQEDCVEAQGRVAIKHGIKRGANRRAAGEDIAAGAIALQPGTILSPAHLALAAAAGHATLKVFKPLRVALLSTGDEVNVLGAALPPGGIYDANRPMLAGLLRRLGCVVSDLGIQPDKRDILARVLHEAAANHDAVISSGGVSTGEEDHVKAAIEANGSLHLWRLAIKPGRPVALGQIGRVPYFGLPGNPVAALLTFAFFARPLLARLGGADLPAPRAFFVQSGFAYKKKTDRREWVRVSLHEFEAGWQARKFAVDGAGVITSLTGTDGIVELEESRTRLEPGDSVRFYPYSALGL